ncbi:MAG: RICIN domain-containing protein [Faecalibacterium prausnitzii]|nr:RICIN domain-containing protein [Faecalibacterium prausnitzii]
MKTVAQTVIEADRFYTIAARTGSVIEAVASTKNEETVRLGKYDHKPEQEWAFIRVGDGVYRIRNRASGKLLDLMMTGTANGTWLHLWEDVGGTSQMWTVEPTPAGTVRLRSSWASGKCIDTVGIGVSDGVQLQIWQETAGEDQLWTISEVKDRASAKRTAKKDEPAAPVEEKVEVKAEEKPVEAAPVVEAPKAEEAKAEPVKAEEKPAEAAPAVEAPKVEEVKAEPAKMEVKPAEKAAPAAVKAPVKKPAARKTSRAARKKAAAKK